MQPSATRLETGTTAITGNIIAVTFVTDSTLTALTGLTYSGDSLSGVTFPAGLTIYGNFSAITLATGSALIYLGGPQGA